MKICGVEIKGNDAIISLLSLSNELFNIPDCRVRRLTLADIKTAKGLRDFQFAFAKLMEDYQIEKVVIRQRPMKGKFAGGAIGFKMEAAIQLIDNLAVEIITPLEIKESLKRHPVHIPFVETGLKGFQQTAFNTAFAFLNGITAPSEQAD